MVPNSGYLGLNRGQEEGLGVYFQYCRKVVRASCSLGGSWDLVATHNWVRALLLIPVTGLMQATLIIGTLITWINVITRPGI